jgi:hypothetical protein
MPKLTEIHMEFGKKDQEVRNKFSAAVLHHTAIIS